MTTLKPWPMALCAALWLAGCATYEPVPKGHTGPTATVRDTGMVEDGTKARMFALMEVDGQNVMNAFWASASTSRGKGPVLIPTYTERAVPVRPMKVLLRGSHATGAPVHELASRMAGTFFSVEGTVDFLPEADHTYVVTGDLKKERSSVWIEDAATGKPVTPVVSSP